MDNIIRICPFCAEKIKKEAIKCKHCGSDLSEIIQKEKVEEDKRKKELAKENKKKARREKYKKMMTPLTDEELETLGMTREEAEKRSKKSLAIIFSIIGLFIYYISVPIVMLWYIWKKTKWQKKTKWISTVIILLAYFVLVGNIRHINRKPTITILEPANNYEVQAKSVIVKGLVDPKTAIVKIGEADIQVNIDGKFSYEAQLDNQKNDIKILADNNGKNVEIELVVNRVYTEEELEEIEKIKEENKKQEEQKRAESEAEQKRIEEEQVQKQIADTKENLKKEIENINNFKGDDYRGSVDKINQEVLLFTNWAGLANGAKKNENVEIQNIGKDLEAKLVQLQIKEYPKIRLAWGKLMKNTLWEHNIEAKVFGSKNATMELIGGHFANNKNIKDTQGTLQEMLKKLRFDRINYKWYKYDSEFTYYQITSKKDNELYEL